MGLLIAFLCVRPAIRKGKAEDDYAEEGMCVGMCLGLMLGSLSDSSNSGLGASLGMLFGLVIGLCVHKKRKMTIAAMRNKCCSHPHDQQTVSLRRWDWDEEKAKRIFSLFSQETLQHWRNNR